jgi:AbrB family looped-hinge helix DNA binding protein
MQAVLLTTVSPKFQMVVPKAVRHALNLVVGQKVEFQLNPAGRYEIVPRLPMTAARGMFPGVSAPLENEEEDASWPGGCAPLANAVWKKPVRKTLSKSGSK